MASAFATWRAAVSAALAETRSSEGDEDGGGKSGLSTGIDGYERGSSSVEGADQTAGSDGQKEEVEKGADENTGSFGSASEEDAAEEAEMKEGAIVADDNFKRSRKVWGETASSSCDLFMKNIRNEVRVKEIVFLKWPQK